MNNCNTITYGVEVLNVELGYWHAVHNQALLLANHLSSSIVTDPHGSLNVGDDQVNFFHS